MPPGPLVPISPAPFRGAGTQRTRYTSQCRKHKASRPYPSCANLNGISDQAFSTPQKPNNDGHFHPLTLPDSAENGAHFDVMFLLKGVLFAARPERQSEFSELTPTKQWELAFEAFEMTSDY